jgi:protein disulfide-isomerase
MVTGIATKLADPWLFPADICRLVEFFSPYCHHCKALAPTWQTLYEFYYTMNPLQGSTQQSTENLNSFTRYYNFKFAKVDCVAFGTACSNKEVSSFPTIILFKDGKVVKSKVGVQSLGDLSKWVEETLESIRPGSRPQEGPKLPKVGASSVEPTDEPAAKEDKGKDPAAGAKAGEKHNEIASSASASGLKVSPTKAASKLEKAPNPKGTSVPLTAEKFQKLVTTTLDPWFVKFYAPWCHHCQAMAPNWNEMAREMEGVLNIGEVNCDVEKRLCKDAHVKGYPTLLFFRGGERVEYNGLRGVGDLIAYAKKATDVGSGVTDVDAATFEKMEETEEVIFVYFYDHATTSEDFAALERLTLSLIGHAKLVKTKDPKMAERFKISTWPRLMVSRDGKPSYYQYIAPKDMRDFRKVLNWMKTVWQPIVPELTASNAREIMDGHYVVLGILSRQRSDEFIIAKREIKNAALEWIDKETHARQLERQELRDAKQLRIEEAEDRNDQRALRAAKQIRIDMDAISRPKVRFAWVDGVFWERWIRTTYGIDVKDGERVVINDEDVGFFLSSFRFRNHAATNSLIEPPLLGPNNNWQPHRPQPHIDPRNNP